MQLGTTGLFEGEEMVSSFQGGRCSRRLAVLASTFVALLGVPSCQLSTSPQRSPLKLTTERSVYFPGDLVRFWIQNTSDEPVVTSDCNGILQFSVVFTWVDAPTQTGCFGTPITLAPGESASFTEPLLTSLSPGRYRLLSGAILDQFYNPLPHVEPSAAEFDVKSPE